MGISAPACGGLGCRVVQRHLWGKARGQEATGKCPRQVSKRVHTWAARGTWPFECTLGPMGRSPSGPEQQRTSPNGPWHAEAPWSGCSGAVQPVGCLSSSLRKCSQLPDRIQVPHHHPRRVDDHCEDGFSPEATDNATRVDILGLQQGGQKQWHHKKSQAGDTEAWPLACLCWASSMHCRSGSRDSVASPLMPRHRQW